MQREDTHQVLTIWSSRTNRVSDEIPPSLQVIVYLNENSDDDVQQAFYDFLRALKRLRDLTRLP
jgi:cell division protein FtsX